MLPFADFCDPGETEQFIKTQFANQPNRLRHLLVIADRVRQSARDLNELRPGFIIDEDTAFCAALVHDVGYLEPLVATGFHPLDGYEFLKERGFQSLGELILGHSASPEEASLRGLSGVWASDDPIAKLVTYWDVQVRQGGEVVGYEARLADIFERYGEHSIVGRAHRLAKPRIEGIIHSIDRLLQREPM